MQSFQQLSLQPSQPSSDLKDEIKAEDISSKLRQLIDDNLLHEDDNLEGERKALETKITQEYLDKLKLDLNEAIEEDFKYAKADSLRRLEEEKKLSEAEEGCNRDRIKKDYDLGIQLIEQEFSQVAKDARFNDKYEALLTDLDNVVAEKVKSAEKANAAERAAQRGERSFRKI